MSVLTCNLLMAAYEEDENWPEIFVKVRKSRRLRYPSKYNNCVFFFFFFNKSSEICLQVYIEDSLGERIWVDSSHCKNFVDNIQTAFGTKMPPKSMLLQADTGRTAGDLSAGGALYSHNLWRFKQALVSYFLV